MQINAYIVSSCKDQMFLLLPEGKSDTLFFSFAVILPHVFALEYDSIAACVLMPSLNIKSVHVQLKGSSVTYITGSNESTDSSHI